MESSLITINRWLLPLSWLYGVGIGLRNWLFDVGWLKSRTFDFPLINVGNITVGGTGKTPHVEYLLRLLGTHYRTAVLSRGYKRTSRGYLLATDETSSSKIGDEPWQMKHKFPQAYIAVDANRCRGITRLCSDKQTSDVQVILLDDAYQHRYVKPGLNILLTDYHRLITDDCLLPAGRLREKPSAMERAHMVIVTKCPSSLTPMGFRVIQQSLNLKPFQSLYFSTVRYGTMRALYSDATCKLESLRPQNVHVILVTGIGCPQEMEQDLRRYAQHIKSLAFPDHHHFHRGDIQLINKTFADSPNPKIVITTEKDAARLQEARGLDHKVRENLFALPVQIEIMREQTTAFNETILDYVRKNSRNSRLA